MRARQPRLPGPSSGTCSGAGSAVGGLDAGDVNDGEVDVLHKVHVMLHTRMDTIRVQVNSRDDYEDVYRYSTLLLLLHCSYY